MGENQAVRGPRLRLVCINDVYALDNLPRLATLIRHAMEVDPADLLLTSLAGDFLAPSMLSSLDKGRGMVDCLNALPITHVTFGNHEDDVDANELRLRVREFRGTWLATNVKDFVPGLPDRQVVEVGQGASRRVRVGLLGVVMADSTVYRRAPFGGCVVEDANTAALRVGASLMRDEKCACVIPLTHQPMDDDRALARSPGAEFFPVIVGGHEHTVFLEHVAHSWVEKAGMDAVKAAVVDLAWPATPPPGGSPDLPEVKIEMVPVAQFDEEKSMRARVDAHLLAVRELESAVLMYLPAGTTLSSVGTRSQPASLATLLCTLIRDAEGADLCLLNGGGIRASREYRGRFTYGDLKAEVPFDNNVVVVTMPGKVIREAVAFSRAKSPAESGGYLHTDEGTRVDEPSHIVTTIASEPVADEREYRVALMWNFLAGMDHNEVFTRFARDFPDKVPTEESGREAKIVLVDAFSTALWRKLGSFEEIDTDHSGEVTAAEITAAIQRVTLESPSAMAVELLLRSLDADKDNVISRREAEELSRRNGGR